MRPSIVLFLATSLALGPLHAQTLAPPVPPGPPPPPPGVMQDLSPTQLTSTITQFLVNPNGEVDGLLLQDGNQVVTPPPLSSVVTSALHVGDVIRISGDRVGALPLIARAQITTSSGEVVVQADLPPPPPGTLPSAPALIPMTASGIVARSLFGPAGDVTGALLSDGTELRLPRPATPDLQNVMQPNRHISVRGFGTQSRWGRSIQVTAMGTDAGNEQDIASPPPAPRP